MKLLLCTATRLEIEPTLAHLQANYEAVASNQYRKGTLQIDILVTGVGLPLAAFSLGRLLATHTYDLAIQAGVAGAIDRNLPLGQVVQVRSERFADLGVEEADGRFTSMHQLDLIGANEPPFRAGRLLSPAPPFAALPQVSAISVNKVHGHVPSIERIVQKYPDAQVESMEGAAFFYACLVSDQTGIQIRSISNYVEARNRENWELGKAVNQLNTVLINMIEGLVESPKK